MTLARQGGFTGPIMNSYTCQSIEQFMVPAGEAAANVHTLVQIKEPADPAYADDADVQQYLADVRSTARASTRTSATSPPATTPPSSSPTPSPGRPRWKVASPGPT